MYGKILLIALVCVSVAQVHGGLTENAINNGLKKVNGMNEQAKNRYYRSVKDHYENIWNIELRTSHFVKRARSVQDSSRESLRYVAAATEELAMQNNSPESVFQCIRRNEDNANDRIEILTRKFQTDVERLYGTKKDNMRVVGKAYDHMERLLGEKYTATVRNINDCQNPRCVFTAVNSFRTYVNSMVADIRRVEGQIATIMTNYQRDADNYFTNSNRQITMIKSAAIKAIKQCYNGGKYFEESQDVEESQEF